MNKIRPFINHFTLEIWLSPSNDFGIEDFLEQFVNDLHLTVISTNQHIFKNGGITKTYILSTSHIALHTWPELGYFHIDLLSCRENLSKNEVNKVSVNLLQNVGNECEYIIREVAQA